MKKKAKFLLLAAAVIALGIGGTAALLSPVVVEAEAVSPRTATLTFTEQGTYDYSERRAVYPLVAGEVLEVRVREGDTVSAGDVLAVVSASDYLHQIEQLGRTIDGYHAQIRDVDQQELQRREELQATLESLEGQMTTLEAEMRQSRYADRSIQTQIEIQESIVRNQRRIIDDMAKYYGPTWEYGEIGMDSEQRQQYNNARNAVYQAELALEQLHAGNTPDDLYDGQVQSLQSQIDLVSGQLGKSYSDGLKGYYGAQIAAAQVNITQMQEKAGQAEITAPIAGVISELPVRDANVTTGQSAVATIGSGGRVEVYVPIREMDGVAVGNPVDLILDKRLGKETLYGTVTEVEGEAQVRLSALGVEERKVRVLIEPEGDIPVGYDMDVRFTVYSQEDALVVPKTAVFSDGGEDWVWVIEDGAAALRRIAKGIETRDGYIVDEGLGANDLLITDADDASLRQGKKVRTQ